MALKRSCWTDQELMAHEYDRSYSIWVVTRFKLKVMRTLMGAAVLRKRATDSWGLAWHLRKAERVLLWL